MHARAQTYTFARALAHRCPRRLIWVSGVIVRTHIQTQAHRVGKALGVLKLTGASGHTLPSLADAPHSFEARVRAVPRGKDCVSGRRRLSRAELRFFSSSSVCSCPETQARSPGEAIASPSAAPGRAALARPSRAAQRSLPAADGAARPVHGLTVSVAIN